MKKNIEIDKPTKRVGTIVQGMVKNQLGVVVVENASLYPHRYILYYALTV